MAAGTNVTVLALRCDVLATAASTAIDDLLTYFDPHVVYVLTEQRDMRIVSTIQHAFDGPLLSAGTGVRPVQTIDVDGITLAVTNTTAMIGDASIEDRVPVDATYVICDAIRPETDTVRLEATLNGCEHLAAHQAQADEKTTFLTGAAEASYEYVWQATADGTSLRLPIHGMAPLRRSGAPELACLTLDPAGRVAVSSAPADRFGLQALTTVGPTTAERLTTNGYDTRAAVAEATIRELTSIHGIGETTAHTMHQSAQALTTEAVVRVTNETIPAADYSPIFVDIETDGLHPTIIWLIGVYDPTADEYIDFIDTDPSLAEPGMATRAFITWLASEYDQVSLITWNGHSFDFKHLDRFIARHAPAYMDYWNDAVFKYDLYDWVSRKENAILPGRTNRLEDVAAALGCDRETAAAAMDGKTLARAIQRQLRSPERASDIDWDAARAYCEADVRELAAVYRAIEAAVPDHDHTVSQPTDTTQTGLTDF